MLDVTNQYNDIGKGIIKIYLEITSCDLKYCSLIYADRKIILKDRCIVHTPTLEILLSLRLLGYKWIYG